MVQVNLNPYLIPGIPNDTPHLPLAQLLSLEEAINKILEIVSEKTSVPVQEIRNKCRSRDIVKARHLVMYFAVEYLPKYSLRRIYLQLTGRRIKQAHSSVIHGRDMVKDALTGNLKGEYAESIILLVEQIENSLKQFIYERNCLNRTGRQW